MKKKILHISGRELSPIQVGFPALIDQMDGWGRMTTTVLCVRQRTVDQIEFETENSVYIMRRMP